MSNSTALLFSNEENEVSRSKQFFWLGASLLTLGFAAYWVFAEQGVFETQLLFLGAALGLCLYHASFGFSSTWRTLIKDKRGEGLRAQMVMLALSVMLFFPILSQGEFFGQSVSGFVRPLGPSVIFGAFIFGIGMQIANGCASGNLYHSGGGQLRAIPAIIGFSAGAVWATLDYEWWTGLPQLAPVALIEEFGVIPAIAANLAVFFAIYLFTLRIERKTHGALSEENDNPTKINFRRFLQGPWPMVWGAVGIALLNLVTLAMLGRPWVVALAYPLWGAKGAELLGMDLELDFTTYWIQPGRDDALFEPLLADPASLMNIGVIVGAFVAATLAGKFSFSWRVPFMQFIGAAVGGVMLGYGATIAYGCNIGAFVGGIVSGSLHGWLWIAFALAGTFVGTLVRPLFSHK